MDQLQPSDAIGSAPSKRALFPIVGIGASAGGLAATTELLRHLGPNPGVAIVIVHHLDPTRESSLAEIFARATSLPVAVASEGLMVEIGHVYVVPPNADLTVVQGILRLSARADTGGLHLPIDHFLESLASDRAGYAVGVLLSGSGSDGCRGIRAIKAEGGVTFAQDASAEYASMPESAIATGCVDFVLPPEKIATELARLAAHSPPSLAESGDSSEQDFQRILVALRKDTGVDFATYKPTTVRRRVQRRMLVHGLSRLGAYADFLQRTPAEAVALREEILIHVTSFFRDAEVFDALKTMVFPKLVEKRARDSCLRIWVPGCSTGEEVYSLAMSLLEFLADASIPGVTLKLFGTDLSHAAIDTARAGQYPAGIEHDVSPERLRLFFLKTESGYQIQKSVRELCVFARHDLARDPPFSGMDLVSCRNVMIYLGTALQDRVLPLFHYALKERGFLVLGTSETTRSFPGFSALDAKNKIYVCTAAAPRAVFQFSDSQLAETAPASAPAAPATLDVHREADRLVLAEFAPPGVVVTSDLAIVQFRGKTGPFLEPTPGVPSFDLLRMVSPDLRLPMRQAIDEAIRARTETRRTAAFASPGLPPRTVEIEVIPFGMASAAQTFLLVLFRELPRAETPAAGKESAPAVSPTQPSTESQLRQELASTRTYLQSVIEQLEAGNEELRAANEEVVSSNEELRSTNEELQMAKEELQATNEELRTVNEEMTVRNVESMRLGDDLTNVLSSAEIPILMLGRDSRLRRFTPAAVRMLGIQANDVGRRIGELEIAVPMATLSNMITEVVENLGATSRTVQDERGHWYQLTVRPYLTADRRIEGTVVTVFDIDRLKKGEQLLADAREYAESIVDTVRECLLVLDRDLRVRSANRSFQRTFALTDKEIEGRHLYELGHGEWNLPELGSRLRALREGDAIEDYPLERDFKGHGPRVFLLNARPVEHTALLLCALDDVTEKKRAEEAIRRSEIFQHIAFDATVAEERERRRIAAELHDRIGQALALAQIKLTSARESVAGDPRIAMDQAIALLAQSVADTRDLTFDLSPPILYDLGLEAALSWLVEDMEKEHGLHIELHDDGADKLLDDTTAALAFRCVRELLMNALKHAKATVASVSLARNGDRFDITVADDGVGFDVDGVRASNAFGLFSVREQVRRLGGTVEVVTSPNEGTRVTLHLPLDITESGKIEGTPAP